MVDDNADAADMLTLLLESNGHVVMVEHESRRALERARIDTPDVAILDIGLPDMDGNELARRLRAEPTNAGMLLVAVTGYGQELDRSNALDAGFDHHLVKPVDTAVLTALLAQESPRRISPSTLAGRAMREARMQAGLPGAGHGAPSPDPAPVLAPGAPPDPA